MGELRRPEVPVLDARAVRVGGLAMTPTPRPASWETCSVEGDSVDEAWCTTHDRHPGECWDSRESEIKRLTAELAEAKMAYSNVLGRNLPLAAEKVQAQEERDAALAEVERWKDDYDEEARACEENARETQEARAEAEARDQHHKDYHAYCGALSVRQFIEARLSPPAPAPKCAKHDAHHFGSDDGGKTVERYGAIPGTNGREPCQDGSAFAKPAPGGR